MKIITPFNHLIPKEIKANLEWRSNVMRRVIKDPKCVEFYKEACANDPLFFLNGFGWTYNPKRLVRGKVRAKVPFILYPFQEEAILDLFDSIADHDILVEKSRDMGASWCCVSVNAWCWMYVDGFSGLFVSRVDEYVDKAGNPKAMFWKFDYLMKNLPNWLKPVGYSESIHRTKNHVENPSNSAVIDGEATTKRTARGDRRTVITLDEFAAVDEGDSVLSATRDATDSRWFNSTPDGINNAFYKMRQTSIKKIRMHWTVHPEKAKGLYTIDKDGLLKVLDHKNYPIDYKPILDGKVRSPWYDDQCARAGSDREIAQELDIDYLGSGGQFFNPIKIDEIIREISRPPFLIGELEYDSTTGEPIRFSECQDGHLRLWCQLDGAGRPPLDAKYSQGHDISQGTGASNSCAAGYNRITLAKAYEYVNPRIRAEAFATYSVALARFFGDSYMIWGSGGPGRPFGDRVVELGYGNFAMQRREESLSKKYSDLPGIVEGKDVQLAFMSAYRHSLEKGECINYSRHSLEETLEYIYGPNGEVVHAKESGKNDPSGAKSNHGDRVVADALAWKGILERKVVVKHAEKTTPVGSLAWRIEQKNKQKQKNERDGW